MKPDPLKPLHVYMWEGWKNNWGWGRGKSKGRKVALWVERFMVVLSLMLVVVVDEELWKNVFDVFLFAVWFTSGAVAPFLGWREHKRRKSTVDVYVGQIAELRYEDDGEDRESAFTCPECLRVSYHPMDVKFQFCGWCKW